MRLAICLEDRNCIEHEERFQACVAMPSGVPGLSISQDARICWRTAEGPSVHLGATGDGRLALFADDGFLPAPRVTRAGRVQECPSRRPVILLDGDELGVAGGSWRVHLHGPVEESAPTGSPSFVRAAAVIAGLALSAASAAGCAPTQEKPTLPESPGTATDRAPDAPGPVTPPAPPENEAAEKSKKNQPPIEVRDLPPYKPVPYRGMEGE